MIPESWLIWAVLVIAMLVTIIVAEKRHRRRRDLAADGVRPEGSYSSRDDQTLDFFHRQAEEVRHHSDRYDTRTLAELASECPACGGDHIGLCAALEQMQKDLDSEDVLTGTIVAVEDIPAPASDTATLFIPRAQSFTWEIEHQWHRKTDGSWQAPWALLDVLPEDDWLRELLTAPVSELEPA